MFKKVLVPLDGSELAQGILPFVSLLAKQLKAPLTLLWVADAKRRVPAGLQVKEHLQEISRRLAADNVTADVSVSAGDSAREIVKVAGDQGFDLIAMSTHGRGGLGRGVLGSVADEVIRSSPIPTLVVAPEMAKKFWTEGEPISKIVVPLDDSPEAEAVLPYVEELARILTLEVILVRVISTGGPYVGLLDDARFVEINPEIKEMAQNYLEALTERLENKGLLVVWRLLDGIPGERLVDFARETPQNMIALTTRGRSRIERWLEGSVSEALVRASGDPVLVIASLRADDG